MRDCVRVVVLDADGRVLLIDTDGPRGRLWMPPGGGMEAGETDEEAAHRELLPEVGLTGAVLEPLCRRTEHWGTKPDDERWFLARCDAFEPAATALEDYEAGWHKELRWWPLDGPPEHTYLPEDVLRRLDRAEHG